MKEVIANRNDSLSVKSLQGPGCASLLLRAEYGEYLDNYNGRFFMLRTGYWCYLSRSQIMVAVRARAPRIANQTSGLSTCRNLNRDRGMTAWWWRL